MLLSIFQLTLFVANDRYGKAPNDYQIGNEFPLGKLNSFFLNANHEMLSLGNGYYDTLLADNEQQASFISLENEYVGERAVRTPAAPNVSLRTPRSGHHSMK